jgi:hypothetical protein
MASVRNQTIRRVTIVVDGIDDMKPKLQWALEKGFKIVFRGPCIRGGKTTGKYKIIGEKEIKLPDRRFKENKDS